MDEFEEYAEGTKEIEISGKKVKIKPTVKEAGQFWTGLMELGDNPEAINKLIDASIKMIQNANLESKIDNISNFVSANVKPTADAITVALGFIDKKKDIDQEKVNQLPTKKKEPQEE